MVSHPGEFPWSSHRANAAGKQDPLLRPHPNYLALDNSDDQRLAQMDPRKEKVVGKGDVAN